MNSKLAKMIFGLIVVWLLGWTPYAIMCIWGIFHGAKYLTPTIGVIPLVFCKISAGANVMLYGLRYVSVNWNSISFKILFYPLGKWFNFSKLFINIF